ncbi:uncharacterized protein LOC107610350 [Arachis ipaensis]|uniref:uncharacterized protein LOC107610350 n=1 Tax=Arachis ipaensis TaxID=130454 RepID=UPI0007AFB22E|nr:uncharacterized protein LOC107610350 [Arachis ipaensis]
MKSSGCVKDVQRLAGRLTALSRFLGASAAKALPFFNLMRKGIAFEWTPACEEAFNHFKKILATPPVLGKPVIGESLYLYLAITEEALAAVLVREEWKVQQPIYFVSKALQGAELKYSKLEKLALALLTSSCRLRQYFQGHQVVVRTDQRIRQVLQKPDLAGRMMTWAIELSQYDLRYEPRHAIKAQAMADFLVEVTGDPTEDTGTRWKLHIDEASNQTSEGTGIILESPSGVIYEQSVKFKFPVSNNQAEYEALIGGLVLAGEVGATRLEVCSDSQIVTSQVNGSYQARESLLQKYLERVKELSKQFEEVTVQHVPRERNTRADLLSKLASTKPGTGNRPLIQGITKEPAVALHLTKISPSWMDSITDFLQNGKLPVGEKEAKALRRKAAKYTIIQGQLFKKGLSQPLLKCLHSDQMDYVLREVHEGCFRHGRNPLPPDIRGRRNIPVEIGEPSPRLFLKGVEEAVEKDLVDETREKAHLSEVALKQRVALRYNTKVLKRGFEQNELVLRGNDIGLPTQGEGKLAANWEGPFRVKEVIGKGAYKLDKLNGREVPRTWNAGNLRRFYP